MIAIGSMVGGAGSPIEVPITLATNGHLIAAVQNDIVFDANVLAPVGCWLNPVTAYEGPGCGGDPLAGPCASLQMSLLDCEAARDCIDSTDEKVLRVMVLGLGGTNTSSDDPLYTCDFTAADGGPRVTELHNRAVVAVSPDGGHVPAQGVGGAITIEGTVLGFAGDVYENSIAGDPIDNALITFRSEDGSVTMETRSASGGGYQILLPPGRYRVTASHPSYETYSTGDDFFVNEGVGISHANIFLVPDPTMSPECLATPTPCPDAVSVDIGSAQGMPGTTVKVPVTLHTGGSAVAGVQHSIVFDPTFVTLTSGASCRINPAISRSATGCDDGTLEAPCKVLARDLADCPGAEGCPPSVTEARRRLRAIVVAIDNSNPIPDGVLYSCTFTIAPDATGSTILQDVGVHAADPRGVNLRATGANGEIVFGESVPVSSPTPTPTAVP